MLDRIGHGYQAFLIWLVDCCRRAAVWVVIGVFVATGLSAVYIVKNLTLDTDPVHLLDPNLHFRQLQRDFYATFPQLDDLILVVVNQGSAEHRRDAVHELARILEQQPSLFASVYQPQQDDFFDTYGLLYFDVDELWRLDERLAEWSPFLGTLVQDPSLRGFFSILTLALEEEPTPEQQKVLADAFALLSEAIEAQRLGKPPTSSWKQTMLEDVTGKSDPSRGFLLAKPRLDYSSLEAAEGPLEFLRRQGADLEERFDVRIRLTGPIPIEAEERETIARGAGVAAGLSLALVSFVLIAGFRSLRLVGAMLCTLVVGLLWTAVFVVVAVGSLNFISASVPVLFIGLGVDFGIQFGLRYREELSRVGDHEAALRRAVAGVGGALTLAAVAAALSFFSFLPTSYRGFAEMGLIAGVGMFIALFANLTLFPALLTVFPLSRSHVASPTQMAEGGSPEHPVLSSIIRYRRVILGVLIPVVLVAVLVVPRLQFDFHALHLRDPSTESVSTFQELLADPDTSPYVIQVLADNLPAADALAESLRSVPEVDRVLTLSSFVPGDQEEKLTIIDEMALVLEPVLIPQPVVDTPGEEEEMQAMKAFRSALGVHESRNWEGDLDKNLKTLRQAIDNLFDDSGGSTQFVHDLRTRLMGDFPKWLERLRELLSPDEITLETLPESLTSHYSSQDGRTRVEIFPAENVEENQALRRFVLRVQQKAPRAIGSPVSILEGGQTIIDACIQATILAIVASALLLLVVLRRLGETLFVLLPLVLTLLLTVATCLALGIPLNLANVIALPLVLGLGIAFGIYLILRRREAGSHSIVEVLRSSTSQAVLFSALTTMASFGALGFSHHPGMASLGILLVVVLILTMVCALVILPALLAELEQRGWWGASERES